MRLIEKIGDVLLSIFNVVSLVSFLGGTVLAVVFLAGRNPGVAIALSITLIVMGLAVAASAAFDGTLTFIPAYGSILDNLVELSPVMIGVALSVLGVLHLCGASVVLAVAAWTLVVIAFAIVVMIIVSFVCALTSKDPNAYNFDTTQYYG